jgi:hypothetical protein
MKLKQMIRVFKHRDKNQYLIKVMDFMSCGNVVRNGYKGSPVELLESFSTDNPMSDYQKITERFKGCKCSRISEWYKFNPLQYFDLEYQLAELSGDPIKPSIVSLALIAFGTFIISVSFSSAISSWTLENNTPLNQTSESYSFKQLE